MQLGETGILNRIQALIRFCLIRMFYYDRLRIAKISFIGKRLKLIIGKDSHITIQGKIRISDNVELQSNGELVIGSGCGINSNSRIIAFEKIQIGDNVSIAQFVAVLDHDHSYELKDGILDLKRFRTSPVRIGNNVWLGDKVTITKGVTIGDNVVIGANSVVTKDIPANCIAAGIPAKVIKSLI